MKLLYMVPCLLFFASCGKADKETKPQKKIMVEEVQQNDQGTYRAVLKSMNQSVAGDTQGTIEINISEEDVVIVTNVTGAPTDIRHYQNLLNLEECPGKDSDRNKDSLIDFGELMGPSGSILIPLDSDLSEQLNGIDYGPIANREGNYIYRRSTALTELLHDLRGLDPDPADNLMKLAANDKLNLSGKVVVIQSIEGDESLPIACGKLSKVANQDNTTDLLF